MPTEDSSKDLTTSIRRACWEEALHCFGTGYIFEEKGNQLRRNLRVLTFLGIAVPLVIGSVVLAFGTQFVVLPFLIPIAAILLTVQLIVSVWSVVARWDDQFAYALESNVANHRLADLYRDLAKNPPPELARLESEKERLDIENRWRTESDYKQGISDKQKREGFRAALFQFRRACGTCHRVPESMKPTDCPSCGQF